MAMPDRSFCIYKRIQDCKPGHPSCNLQPCNLEINGLNAGVLQFTCQKRARYYITFCNVQLHSNGRQRTFVKIL